MFDAYRSNSPDLAGERRRELRAQLTGLVTSHNASAHFLGRASDISRSGLSIVGNVHPPRGAFVHLQFNVPGHSESLLCQGIVVRSQAPGRWAVEFIRTADMPNAARLALQQVEAYIDRQRLIGQA